MINKLDTPSPSAKEEVADVPPPGDATLPIVKLGHPYRWMAAVVIALLAAWSVRILVVTPTFEWDVVWDYLFDNEVLLGVLRTLQMTVICMVVGITLGTVIAIMRLSPNPILKGVASFYQWFFRGTPTLIQLIFWFNLSSVFPSIEFELFGSTFVSWNTNELMTPFLAAVLGLSLNFAAYHSEIVRAGILSVDEGQSDAADAYGLSRAQTLRFIVLPQAMRVIIPPTANETIGMLKWTSLASIVSYTELLTTVGNIYNTTYQVIPLLIVAALWYLFMTTILSIGQIFIEKRFARGTTRSAKKSAIGDILGSMRRGVRA
ncbi:amino acid ABC transporter permease [Rhodococcus sp. NPDC059968]|uniref:amino acid ABC transporter permease n=1 Tax=Rhodococcus sp. NPDC059968 TaxID=3347017 RepID=UPI0036727859